MCCTEPIYQIFIAVLSFENDTNPGAYICKGSKILAAMHWEASLCVAKKKKKRGAECI